MNDLEIVFKSGRRSVYHDVSYFEYYPPLDCWCVGSIHFRSHEKRFPNSKISSIGFLKGKK